MDDVGASKSLALPLTSRKVDDEPRDIILTSLEACVIDLLPRERAATTSTLADLTITALYGRGLRQCVIVAGQVQGSVRLEDCVDCRFVLGCHQVRLSWLRLALLMS